MATRSGLYTAELVRAIGNGVLKVNDDKKHVAAIAESGVIREPSEHSATARSSRDPPTEAYDADLPADVKEEEKQEDADAEAI
eukprot:15662527-Heterocapsa_arctica.AAC.1